MSDTSCIEKVKEMSAEEKEELVRKIEQTAQELEINFYGCSRCTLSALQRHLGLGNGETFKASLPFAGGIARRQDVCGALLGALMAIGLAFGSDKLEFIFSPEPTDVSRRFQLVTERARRVCDEFEEKFGSLRCCDIKKLLTGRTWDLSNPEDLEEALKPEIHDKCGEVTKTAAGLAARAILEPVNL